MAATENQLYSPAQVAQLIGNGCPSSFIDYLVANKYIQARSKETGKRGRRFLRYDIDTIRYYWSMNQRGIKPKAARERLEGKHPGQRVYMALRFPPAGVTPMVRQLLEYPDTLSIGAYYGPVDLLVETTTFSPLDLSPLLQSFQKDFNPAHILPSIDFLFVNEAASDTNPVRWAKHPESIFARILMRVDPHEVDKISLDALAPQNPEVGTRLEKMAGAWDIMLTAEADSIENLAVVAETIKTHPSVNKAVTLIGIPRHHWTQQKLGTASPGAGSQKAVAMDAFIFAQTHASDLGSSVSRIEQSGVHFATGILGNFDIAAELKTDSQGTLQSMVLDKIGGLPNIRDILTLILIPGQDGSPLSTFPDKPSRSAYCHIYAPTVSPKALLGLLGSIDGVSVYPTFGAIDAVAILDAEPAALSETVDKIKRKPGIDRIVTFLCSNFLSSH